MSPPSSDLGCEEAAEEGRGEREIISVVLVLIFISMEHFVVFCTAGVGAMPLVAPALPWSSSRCCTVPYDTYHKDRTYETTHSLKNIVVCPSL